MPAKAGCLSWRRLLYIYLIYGWIKVRRLETCSRKILSSCIERMKKQYLHNYHKHDMTQQAQVQSQSKVSYTLLSPPLPHKKVPKTETPKRKDRDNCAVRGSTRHTTRLATRIERATFTCFAWKQRGRKQTTYTRDPRLLRFFSEKCFFFCWEGDSIPLAQRRFLFGCSVLLCLMESLGIVWYVYVYVYCCEEEIG